MKDILRTLVIFLFIILITLPGVGFGQTAGPASNDWNALVSQAKKEGVVSIYALWKPKTRIAITDAFRKKYGISAEFFPFSRGEDLAVRAAQEKIAGLISVDVFGAGAPSLMTVLKPKGLLGPVMMDPRVRRESTADLHMKIGTG